jgi:putative hemolysin
MLQHRLGHSIQSAPQATKPNYRCRLALTTQEIQAAQGLRFEVFNLELGEGLSSAYGSALDIDPFDAQCDHLIVEQPGSGKIVGTYRMQTGRRAAQGLGYYSEREFDFSPFESFRPLMLELGRACIHQQHRNFAVLNALWKGIADYAHQRGTRYLVGCSSITSRDPVVGHRAFEQLSRHRAPARWLTRVHPDFVCPAPPSPCLPSPVLPGTALFTKIPRLLSAYIQLGARISAGPAIDREFGSIDFLTWLDIESPALALMRARGRFLPGP